MFKKLNNLNECNFTVKNLLKLLYYDNTTIKTIIISWEPILIYKVVKVLAVVSCSMNI